VGVVESGFVSHKSTDLIRKMICVA
jgi:hypothetical protein